MPLKDKAAYNRYMANFMRGYRKTHKATIRIQRKKRQKVRDEKALATYQKRLAEFNTKNLSTETPQRGLTICQPES